MLPGDDSATLGRPSDVIKRNIIATVVALIEEAWKSVRKHKDINRASSEPTIAGVLYRELWKAKKKLGIADDKPPRIDDEASSRRNDESVKPDGRIDFKFIYTYTEHGFFGLECKRVSGSDADLAKEYVRQGLMRFVEGKYSPGHQAAAMLGFVIDGDTPGSVSLIQNAVSEEGSTVRIKNLWKPTDVFGKYSHLYTTSHLQRGQTYPITILHFFKEL